jgi:hypothetical protein
MPLSRKNMRKSRKNMRKSRKNSRKASRKNSRKASHKNSRKCYRKSSRKNRRNRKQHGGSAMAQSLAQGQQFASFHSNQHGGALMGAPLSAISDSMLPQDLRSFARVGGLDASIADAATQRDPDQVSVQQGGRRVSGRKSSHKASRKNRKASRKNKKNSRKNRKNSSKNKKQHGGGGAPYNQPTMLLSASDAAKAGTADFSNPLLKN